MDTSAQLAILRNNKGMAIVFVAILLVVFCGFLGLAIDIGYVYIAKGQSQNAADSAALAGASQLTGSGFAQPAAKTAAVDFAAKNKTAAHDVNISSDGSNTLSDSNDITVGNWNRSLNPPYLENRTPVNAVKVQTRRTEQSINGPVDLFFGKVIGWSRMPVTKSAIAARLPKAGFYFVIGQNVCNSTSFPVVLHPSPTSGNMAWTSLLQQSTNSNDTKDVFMCPADKLPDEDVCGQSIYTTQGTSSTVFKAVETDFYDPSYGTNKTIVNGVVTSWTIIVPVSADPNPGIQPSPMPVWGYATIRVTRACGAGGGNPCNSSSGRVFTAPGGVCSGGEDDIVIDQVECTSCPNSGEMLGVRPSLVQ